MNPGDVAERLAAFSSLPAIQNAIRELLDNYEPVFLQTALRVALALGLVRLVWRGVEWSYSHESFQHEAWKTVDLIVLIAVTRTLIVFYEQPIPFVGISFTNLFTNFSYWLQQVIEAETLARSVEHLDDLWQRFQIIDPAGLLANLVLWWVQILITLTKIFAIGSLASALVAAAIGTLLGPLCIVWLLVPNYEGVFLNWCAAFVRFNLVPFGVLFGLFVFENVVGQLLTNLPASPTLNDLLSVLISAQVLAAVLPGVPWIAGKFFS